MKIKIFFLFLLSFCLSLPTLAKSIVVDEISFPLEDAYVKDGQYIKLDAPGELRITVRYYDTFRNPDNNSYEMNVRAIPNLFGSCFSGLSPKEVRNNEWGRNSWCELENVKRSNETIEHSFSMSNGVWDTRVGISSRGRIFVTYGKLGEDGTISKFKTTVFLKDGGEETWNKLVYFLRNNWKNRNIGRYY